MADATRLAEALQPNLVDRVVGYFAPERQLRRTGARVKLAMAGGYIGGDRSRPALKEWSPGRGSANADTLPGLEGLRGGARDLVRNAPIATAAVNTTKINVVGTGLRLQSRIDHELLGLSEEKADEWEHRAEFLWRVTSRQLDITRTQSFDGLQGLSLGSVLESGDMLVIRRYLKRRGDLLGLKLQLVEADKISNPNHAPDTERLAGGVEVDRDGAPVAYHVQNRHPGDLHYWGVDQGWVKVPAFGSRSGQRLAILLYERLRPGQVRGVPFLAPAIEPLLQLRQYTESELTATLLDSFFTVFIKTDGGEDVAGLAELDDDDPSDAGQLKLGSGLIMDLAPGEEIESADPRRPNSQFDPFVTAIIRQVGAALNIPFEVLTKHYESSYSAARAALLDAWKFFRTRRHWLASSLCEPVYGWWMDEMVAIGAIDAPGYFEDPVVREAWLGAEWVGDAPGQIDPKKEADAATIRVAQGFSTIDREAAEISGSDFETVHRQRVKETKMRRAAGLDIEPSAERIITENTSRMTDEKTDQGADEADQEDANEE